MQQLPPSTVRLIGSTQVITSVFSVIKELVENSLDAGATNVDIKLENSGFAKIEVRDNGYGVSAESTEYMGRAHYTSKITSHNDINSITTYGFRGEALGSLCAVASVTITTKTNVDLIGYKYSLDHTGRVVSRVPSHLGRGTTVTATGLFDKLPVRKQYYNTARKRRDDVKRVERLIHAFSLVKYGVRFTLRSDNDQVFVGAIHPTELAALRLLLSSSTATLLDYHVTEKDSVSIRAYLPRMGVNPQLISSSTADRGFIFVNERPVRDKRVEKLIKQHCQPYFGGDKVKYLTYCVHVTLPTQLVDINIEPNKTRVLIHKEVCVYDLVEELLIRVYPKTVPVSTNDTASLIGRNNRTSCSDDVANEQKVAVGDESGDVTVTSLSDDVFRPNLSRDDRKAALDNIDVLSKRIFSQESPFTEWAADSMNVCVTKKYTKEVTSSARNSPPVGKILLRPEEFEYGAVTTSSPPFCDATSADLVAPAPQTSADLVAPAPQTSADLVAPAPQRTKMSDSQSESRFVFEPDFDLELSNEMPLFNISNPCKDNNSNQCEDNNSNQCKDNNAISINASRNGESNCAIRTAEVQQNSNSSKQNSTQAEVILSSGLLTELSPNVSNGDLKPVEPVEPVEPAEPRILPQSEHCCLGDEESDLPKPGTKIWSMGRYPATFGDDVKLEPVTVLRPFDTTKSPAALNRSKTTPPLRLIDKSIRTNKSSDAATSPGQVKLTEILAGNKKIFRTAMQIFCDENAENNNCTSLWDDLSADQRTTYERMEAKERERYWYQVMSERKASAQHIQKKRKTDVKSMNPALSLKRNVVNVDYDHGAIVRHFRSQKRSSFEEECLQNSDELYAPIGYVKSIGLWMIGIGSKILIFNHSRARELEIYDQLKNDRPDTMSKSISLKNEALHIICQSLTHNDHVAKPEIKRLLDVIMRLDDVRTQAGCIDTDCLNCLHGKPCMELVYDMKALFLSEKV